MNEAKSPHPVDVAVGARVKAARVSLGVSQSALAERLGLTFQQIQKYERGANRISASKLVEIAESLGVPPASFFEGVGPDPERDIDFGLFGAAYAMELLVAYEKLPIREKRVVLHLTQELAGEHATQTDPSAAKS